MAFQDTSGGPDTLFFLGSGSMLTEAVAMKVFAVLAHPEHQSFNGAMFRTAIETFSAGGHEVRTSDLHAMQFDPISGRHNFITVKDPDYFKQQIEGNACDRSLWLR